MRIVSCVYAEPKSNTLRASLLTFVSVAIFAGISLFANRSHEDPEKNQQPSLPLTLVNSIVSSFSVGRRDLSSADELNFPTVDPFVVREAETAIHAFLNAERKMFCKELKIYKDAGKVNLATHTFSQGQPQGLFEVQFGKEVFFARLALTTARSNPKVITQCTVLEMVPSPCHIGLKNQLAITVEGETCSCFHIIDTMFHDSLLCSR